MIFIRGGNPLSKPDSELAKAINNLLEQQRKESELCPKCVNDLGRYNPVCVECVDFCNFKERKENKEEFDRYIEALNSIPEVYPISAENLRKAIEND